MTGSHVRRESFTTMTPALDFDFLGGITPSAQVTVVKLCNSSSYVLLQGRQRHKRSGTAHYRSALPGGAVRVDRAPICPREARKKIFACIFSDEEALS